MKVLILGIDGYIGYSLALHLLKRGTEVFGVDNRIRRDRVADVGSDSLTPIASVADRTMYMMNYFKNFKAIRNIDISISSTALAGILYDFKPDTIVHLAEQPSAPWSMQSNTTAARTQMDNVIGTLNLLWGMKIACPEAHLIKLGTMGEYGTPGCDIPEGRIPEGCLEGNRDETGDDRCPMGGLLFPRTAGSFYHLSKVHDTHNIEFACRNWGLRSTDIMQGIVFGLNDYSNSYELTRFDYDEYFGTVLNRFCVQALIGMPLTIYGSGGQTRGLLPLKDSIQCLTIAIDNPPLLGEYRTLNQFESLHTVRELAFMVASVANEFHEYPVVENIDNPRKEAESHYYNPTHQKLFNLGYEPTTDIQKEITLLMPKLRQFKDRIITDSIMPKTRWI